MVKINLERPIAFHPQLAKVFGSINTAIYFQQLNYWSDKGIREDGFIYKTKEQLWHETTLTECQQDACRKRLENKGFIETKLIKANGTPTLHYKISEGNVQKALMENECTFRGNPRKPKNENQENLGMETKKTLVSITESTTKNTTDSKDNTNVLSCEKPQKTVCTNYRTRHDGVIVKKPYPQDFLEFYEAYPRRIGKKVAYNAWKRLSKEERRQAITALPTHINCKKWEEDNGKYIPHPSTWLNQGRWDDEIPKAEIVKTINWTEYDADARVGMVLKDKTLESSLKDFSESDYETYLIIKQWRK